MTYRIFFAPPSLTFDDIREEDYVPSYAGGSSRVDFLLKREGIVVEVKKTKDGRSDRAIGEELLVDIARYKGHPDAKTLVCFIYDPEETIKNPAGLQTDLEKSSTEELTVVTIIVPI